MANLASSLNFDASAVARPRSSSSPSAQVERFLNEYLTNLMSTLLVLPDNPELGVLYLLSGVLNLINTRYAWENLEIKFNLLLNVIVVLSSLKQENYLHHVNFGIFCYKI